MTGMGPIIAGLFSVIYVCLFVFIVWLVITTLRRIAAGVEDIAQTLRRIEANGPPGNRPL